MRRYTCAIKGSEFSTKDRDLFTAHLLTLDEWGKRDVLMAHWDSINIEDCCGGDALDSVTMDVIRYGGELYGLWMDNLIKDMEELIECDKDSMTKGNITVEWFDEDEEASE